MADVVPQARAEKLNKPVRFSHGTLECEDLAASRAFYEEFLGLDCVRHGKRSMLIRYGNYMSVVCLEVGKGNVRPLGVQNHWGIDLDSKEAVDRARALALEHKARYGIKRVMGINESHGTYAFYFQDRDGNWWEFQHVDAGRYDTFFAEGDRFPMTPDPA